MTEKEIFSERILSWWSKNKRNFPWRCTENPYHILVAEIFLKKTSARQVDKIYNKFLEKYPNPLMLSEAKEDELKELLRPLGLENKRAVLLIKLGQTIRELHGGSVPKNLEELLKLPGVGMYAANAVLCFSFSEDVPLLDVNFIRIIYRVFEAKSQKSRAREDKKIWNFAKSLIPKNKAKDFNLAVIDFGALICKAKKTECIICPIKDICRYYKKIIT